MDQQQLMLLKKEVCATTNTVGWRYVMQIAEQLVKAAEAAVIAEAEESKIVGLQRKAQAARDFFNKFRQKIEATKQVESAEPDDSLLYEVACD